MTISISALLYVLRPERSVKKGLESPAANPRDKHIHRENPADSQSACTHGAEKTGPNLEGWSRRRVACTTHVSTPGQEAAGDGTSLWRQSASASEADCAGWVHHDGFRESGEKAPYAPGVRVAGPFEPGVTRWVPLAAIRLPVKDGHAQQAARSGSLF